jgi:MFS family permease
MSHRRARAREASWSSRASRRSWSTPTRRQRCRSNEGSQLRSVSLWGAAAAVGAAAGPLLGGVLVDVTGWQGLFWVDATVAGACVLMTAATVGESRDPDRPRTIDFAGTLLIALVLTPLILGVSKSGDWGWISAPTLGCFAISVASGVAFVAVEQKVAVPLLDLALLRNRVLVGSTIAILIGAGTINALMYLLSLYFQILPPSASARSRPDWRRCRPPAPARRDRGGHGHVQRPRLVGGHGVRPREAGRWRLRRLEHGAVRLRPSRPRWRPRSTEP